MSHVEVLNEVPNDKVAETKTSYESEGATVQVVKGDTHSTLIAIFPGAPASATAQAAAAHGAKVA